MHRSVRAEFEQPACRSNVIERAVRQCTHFCSPRGQSLHFLRRGDPARALWTACCAVCAYITPAFKLGHLLYTKAYIIVYGLVYGIVSHLAARNCRVVGAYGCSDEEPEVTIRLLIRLLPFVWGKCRNIVGTQDGPTNGSVCRTRLVWMMSHFEMQSLNLQEVLCYRLSMRPLLRSFSSS